jgi:hypothetical protein
VPSRHDSEAPSGHGMSANVPSAEVAARSTWRGGLDDAPRFWQSCLTFPTPCHLASALAPAKAVSRVRAVLVQESDPKAASGHEAVELVVPGRVHPWPHVSNVPKEPLRCRARAASQQKGRNATCDLNSSDTHPPTLTSPSRQVKRTTLRNDVTGARWLRPRAFARSWVCGAVTRRFRSETTATRQLF